MINKFSSPIEALKSVYGYDSFRDGQEDVINQVVSGKDGLFVRATGGGKSITYQIPALCREGTTIVVSPLIALMKDQVEDLVRRGVPAAYINSSLSPEESIDNINSLMSGKYKIFYVAPERLKTDGFVEALLNTNISFFAIDEAHCVSTWGQDFRPSYRKIKDVLEIIENAKGQRIQRYACTATATNLIREDIISELSMNDNFEIVGGFDRPNIDFMVRKSYSKINDLVDMCKQKNDGTTIVYCPTVNGVESVGRELHQNGLRVGVYHGQLESSVKNSVQEKFINGEIDIMVATNAFGMGVDKDNVRHVIHMSMPGNIENYYQEAGRGGRDGKPAKATMLYNERDRSLQEFFIDCGFPKKESIFAVQVFLSSFDDGMPINFSYSDIAMISPDTIKEYQVEAILRILDDQGVIRLHNFEVRDPNPTIEIIDASKVLDLSYLDERRKNVLDSLNIMDRYSKTKRCLREFILDYFDEEPEFKQCGHCGTCYENELERGQIEGIIPDEAVRACLGLAGELTKKVTEPDFTELLLGVRSRIFIERGLNDLNNYGALSNWTRSDVSAVVSRLIQSEYLYCSDRSSNSVIITPKGEELAKQSKITMVKATEGVRSVVMNGDDRDVNNDNRVKSTHAVLDHVLYQRLQLMRTNLSNIHEKAPFMIISDSVMKLIAITKPVSKDELSSLGMTPSRIKSYGEDIIRLVIENEKNLDQSSSLNV